MQKRNITDFAMPSPISRRAFAFGLGAGAFAASGQVGASMLDLLANAVTESAISGNLLEPAEITPGRIVEHWRVVENDSWRWLEQSHLVNGLWQLSGITLPTHRETGLPVDGRDCADYLLECEAPAGLVDALDRGAADYCFVREGVAPGPSPMPERKARDGRPPSLWARQLDTAELRTWLSSFEPPQADVGGMTFFEHLTRDHGFDAEPVAGLTEHEQAKLHGAAHGGY